MKISGFGRFRALPEISGGQDLIGQGIEPIRPWTQRPECCAVRNDCIEVENLSVSYNGRNALSDVNVTIPRGGVTAIVGPSGCGKSTFLNTLNRMTDLIPGCIVSGKVSIEGQNIFEKKVNLVSLRRHVGMVFQKPNPFPLSIRKNLSFPLKYHGMRNKFDREAAIENILKRVGLWEEVSDRLDFPALGLSGGQQQRLCIARSLVLDPEVILFDEPCSALDPIASAVVEDLILSLRGQYTIIVVTHNLAQARRLADDVAMFWYINGAGALVEYGTSAKIFESPESEITAAYIRGAKG
jgi:phosphate transport system ATP-binding protein